jgi:hypothetical protein
MGKAEIFEDKIKIKIYSGIKFCSEGGINIFKKILFFS